MELNCPVPAGKYDKITIGHGGGGKLTAQLIEGIFKKELGNIYLNELHDGAVMDFEGKLAFSTDSFVVNPLFFPGGDIGKLAVCGTINDLACCGAEPMYLSLGLILEEGLPVQDLCKIIRSVKETAESTGVIIVTGDTKVVEKGKGDKVFINTSGIGRVREGIDLRASKCKPGDKIIINGKIAEHGMAIMSSREKLQFDSEIISDCAALSGLAGHILKSAPGLRVMRDPTRGGVATALNEISYSCGHGFIINEADIPVRDDVKAACEIFGFDPLYVANEGKIIAIVPPEEAASVIETMKKYPSGSEASIIGEVSEEPPGLTLKTLIGSHRILNMISGEQLPRIC